jgi:MFS family permease
VKVGYSILARSHNAASWVGNLRTFSALKVKPYRNFWFGLLAIYFGVQVQSLSQAWLAYELTRSPLKLGLVTAAWGLPVFFLSVFGGVVADRMSKRKVLIWSRLWISAVTLVTAVLVATGRIEYWHLIVSGVALGFGYAFSMAANQSIIPELVPPELTLNAIALNNGGFNLSRVAGPALAGLLIGFIGTGGAFYVATVCYLIAIVVLWMLPTGPRKGKDRNEPLLAFLLDGLKYLSGSRPVMMIMALELVLLFIAMPFQNFMPAFAERFEVKALGYGFLVTMIGVGAVIGSLSVASLGDYRRKGRLLLYTGVAYGFVLAAFTVIPSFGVALPFLIAIGVFGSSYLAISNTLIQLNVTDSVRGRVMSVYLTVSGLQPLGVLTMGALSEAIGLPLAVGGGGIVLLVIMIVMLFTASSIKQLE